MFDFKYRIQWELTGSIYFDHLTNGQCLTLVSKPPKWGTPFRFILQVLWCSIAFAEENRNEP
jgi:hypothetical protein